MDDDLRRKLQRLLESLDAAPRQLAFPTLDALGVALGAATALPAVLVVGECAVRPGRSRRPPLGPLRQGMPGGQVLLAVRGDGSALLRALRAGADGYVRLDEPLEAALRTFRAALDGALLLSPGEAERLRHEAGLLRSVLPARGDVATARLAPREREVLRLLAAGHTQPDMARRLGVALPTVNTHVQRIYDKLGVRSAAAAVYEGVRRGLIPL